MTDSMTRDRIQVSVDGGAGPYLMVPLDQLPRIKEVLDAAGEDYWVDSAAIAIDGRPAVVVINFGRAGDATRIQTLLDSVN